MKFVLIVLVNWVLITIVGVGSGSVPTPVPDTQECNVFTCDTRVEADCRESSSFFDDEANVHTCVPSTGVCFLGRTKNSDGTFVYRGACDDVLCIEASYDDTDPDSIFDCCEGLQCNSDISVFPAVCDSAQLPAMDNGNYAATSTNAGDTATAACDSDYKLSGSNTLECLDDGTWAAAGATCVRKNCDAAPFPDLGNGTFTAGSKYVGDTALALCNSGYEQIGSAIITCQATEDWSASTAECDRIHCELDQLPTIVNGSYDAPANGRNMGDKATLTCAPGHYINGSSTIECQADRTWTPPDATCDIATDCSQDPLPTVINGAYTASSVAFGDEATAACDSGHEFDNGTPAVITCQNDGTWETPNPLPSCTQTATSAISNDSGSPTGPIVGGVCGSVGGLSLVGGSIVVLRRMLTRNNNQVQPLG